MFNSLFEKDKWVQRALIKCQATDCMCECVCDETQREKIELWACFEVVHNNITPTAFINVKSPAIRYLSRTLWPLKIVYNTANCTFWMCSPLWKVESRKTIRKSIFYFFYFLYFFFVFCLRVSFPLWFNETLKTIVDLKSTCAKCSMCVPLRSCRRYIESIEYESRRKQCMWMKKMLFALHI